jgi:hypothetical protein
MELKLNLKMLGVGQLTKVVDNLNKVNEKFDALRKNLKDNTKAMGQFADVGFVRFFDSLNNKMFDLVKTQQSLKASGGYFGLMGAKFAEFNQLLESFGAKSFVAKIKLIGSAIGSWLVPLALIAGALYVVSRVWKENIGGIQTKWIAFMGKLQNTWSRFDIELRKFLHDIGPLFDTVFGIGFAILEGIFEGFVATVQVFVGVFGPFLKAAASFFGMMNKDGQSSLAIWKAIGVAIGIVGTALAGFMIIAKIIAMVKMMSAAMMVFNAIVTANPIGAIIVAIVAIIALIVYLQKRFNIFGKAVEIVVTVFKWLWEAIKKIFSFAVENSPLFMGIKLISKAVKWLRGKDKEEEDVAASTRAGKTVAASTNVNNRNVNDNRSANVVIHTNQMDPRQARETGNAFINPVLDANKSL